MAPAHSSSVLREASGHVWYEIWMLLSVGCALAGPLLGEGVARNAFVESFALHARSLVGFLFGGKVRPTDLIAADYFDSAARWAKLRGGMPPELRVIGPRVRGEIAHLSYERLAVTAETKGWDVPAIVKAIAGLGDKFAGAVPPDLLHPHWTQTQAPRPEKT